MSPRRALPSSHSQFSRRTALGLLTAGATAGVTGFAAAPAQAAAPLAPRPPRYLRGAAEDVRKELLHTWNAYKRIAWGHDELRPVSGTAHEFFDEKHPVGLTIVEALDTLYLMGLDEQLAAGVKWIKNDLDFSQVNASVQVFETNIRMVGGLLSGYLATGEKALLDNARKIADILLPCFTESKTGIPFQRINPKTGEITGGQNVLAELGTIVMEFGTLSRLTRDRKYYEAAKKAMKSVVDKRSDRDLVGTRINVETGEWVDGQATIHPPVDSFYEYLWDAWDLFRDKDFKRWFDLLTPALIKHAKHEAGGHVWFGRVNMETGKIESTVESELGSFYAGLLGQSGRVALGDAYLSSWTSLLGKFNVLPEEYDPANGSVVQKGNQLRPEYVDSCFNLWLVTGKEKYRKLAHDYYLRQKKHSRVANGWTIIEDVTTTPVKHGDLTSGYWWSEQMKYWYLMFSGTRRFDYRRNYLSTEGNVFRGLIRT